ncbi:threonine--tRNA ligase [Oligosphaera ethanolica]|uniref:Threonine--tRNA ligase n=1 Tax=Oligosphaera ethanolica TaxID=760260 RepID=A0AAE3VE47_9BACT|nr:threonine--tRNA ligase [Oligosphaera ethanolica]MDQ0288839.1 threonyl-tRNA synthetase [Oligosphaera ethanolica]
MSNSDLHMIRHSAAHIMAAVVQKLYPDVKFDIGPATDEGFYYDFDMSHRLVPEDLKTIEKEMRKMLGRQLQFERREVSREEARQYFAERNQTFKLSRLDDIPEGEAVSLYQCADFVDLCRGPHVAVSTEIGAVKLLSIAGSYFRGNEKNPMLQRVYGTAFATKEELQAYLDRIEEAKKRDHRRIGTEMDLYSTHEEIGPGLICWHPNGARVRHVIETFWKQAHYDHGYELLYTPHVGRALLWETSGHLDFYREGMYSSMDVDGDPYYVKPMNCPFHIEVYKDRPRSYRELPLRWAELGTVYRYEKAGVLHGLLRVRGFTQDDAHIICTPEQIEDEIREVLRFSLFMWKKFGFKEIKAYLATRPAKAVGDDSMWEQALVSLEKAVHAEGVSCERDEGGGAFYGPKIDLKIKDALGREWQTSTIQFDFNLPERFDMTYVGQDGQKHRPYMVHRALLGSIERFFGILVEHYAGAFPLWLAPEQIRILPISEKFEGYAQGLAAQLKAAHLRVSVDVEADPIGGKIRRGRNQRLPYLLIVGEREAEQQEVSVRSRAQGEEGAMPFAAFLERARKENDDMQ